MGVFNILYKSLTILRLSRWLLSAFGVELIFEILLNLFGASQVDCKLCRLLFLGWLYRLREDLGILFKKWWHSQLARKQNWGLNNFREFVFVFFYLESIGKRKSEPASSLPRVADEGETLERVPVVLVNICDSMTSSIFNINIICTNHMYACPYAISISSIINHMDACRRVPPSPRSSGASFTTIIANTLLTKVDNISSIYARD